MKKQFTLVEIVITLIIIALLVTIAIPIYNNIVEDAKAKTCKINLQVLLGALEAYGIENNQLPGSLSELRQENLNNAWVKVLEKEGKWKVKFAYFIVDFDKRGLVYAQGAWVSRYAGALQYISCPADDTPPPAGFSYGIDATLTNMAYRDYEALPDDTIVIGDCDTPTFNNINMLDERHTKYKVLRTDTYALAIKKGQKLVLCADMEVSGAESMPESEEESSSTSPGIGSPGCGR